MGACSPDSAQTSNNPEKTDTSGSATTSGGTRSTDTGSGTETTTTDDGGDDSICVLAPSGGAVGFCDFPPPEETTGTYEPPGEIAFSRWTGSEADIMVVPAAGGSPVALTTEVGRDESPSYSAQGDRIAFSSTRDGNAEIYVMDADGSNPTRLTDDPEADVRPVFGFGAPRIAYVHGRGCGALAPRGLAHLSLGLAGARRVGIGAGQITVLRAASRGDAARHQLRDRAQQTGITSARRADQRSM